MFYFIFNFGIFLLTFIIFILYLNKIKTVDINLNQLDGVWYQVARTPNPYQNKKKCKNPTANYKLTKDDLIRFNYNCNGIKKVNGLLIPYRKKNQRQKIFKNEINGKFIKLMKGVPSIDVFNVLYFNKQYMLITDLTKKYLWVMTKTPLHFEKDKNQILKLIKLNGFNINNLIYT